jgi:predicted dehydrogenase
MKKINVGIIGLGVVGQRRKKFINKNKNYNLIAISDVRFKKNFKKKKISYYKNFKDVLKLNNIDAVYVTLPNYLASQVTINFLKKGVHVFCEKPPGRNPDDIKKVISVEKRNKNIKLKYGFNHRYHESIKLAKKIISQKMYGDVVNIRAIYGKSKIITFKKCDWRAKRKFAGGGILLDQGIHLLDLLYYFVGKFEKYKSFISNRYWKYDVEDNAFGLMKNGKGVIASIHSTATQWQHKFSMEISLNHATLLLNGILSGSKSYGKETITIISKKNKIKKKIFYSKDNSWKQEIDEFAEIILKNLKVKTGNSEQALDVMNMVYKIYKDDKSWRYN